MSDEIISQARAFLETSQPEKALDLLYPYIESQIDSIPYLSILGETYLENNELEKAYQILTRGCELDPNANEGFEKFLYWLFWKKKLILFSLFLFGITS